jgi:hypothetical protein
MDEEIKKWLRDIAENYMDKQIVFLCKKLKAHSVRLTYTSCNLPWQVSAYYDDGSKEFFRLGKTVQEAISFVTGV